MLLSRGAPARHYASQVRDVAPRIGQQRSGDGCDERVWSLSSNVLPSEGKLRPGRGRRARAEEEGTPGSSQTSGRCLGFHQEAARPRQANSRARTCDDGPSEILGRGSSEDDRTRVDWKKNSAVSRCTVAHEPAEQAIVDRYESLRAAALGGGLPLERLVAMTTDFARLWSDPSTLNRERKRMLAYVIEDATLIKNPHAGTTTLEEPENRLECISARTLVISSAPNRQRYAQCVHLMRNFVQTWSLFVIVMFMWKCMFRTPSWAWRRARHDT